ncbi:wall associated protein [Stenotrophomonas maltophilia]
MYARIAAAALLCITALPASSANRGSTVMEDYAAALNARGQILQLDTGDMFGEKIGLFTGSVEFLQTDVDLPGNSALEVSIKRRLVAGAQGRQGLGMFGVWDLALPRVYGTFSTQGGWKNYVVAEPLNRCSKFTPPPTEIVTVKAQTPTGPGTFTEYFNSDEFWHGTQLYLPETGEEDLLVQSNEWPVPSTGHAYPMRTKSGNVIRCVAMDDGAGEGFEVTTPAGITYTLNHMASLGSGPPLIKKGYSRGNFGSVTEFEFVLFRQEFHILPTSARDRSGNSVTYTWDPANPRQLLRIAANDGRIVDLEWTAGSPSTLPSEVSAVRAGGRTWTYGTVVGGYKVTFPDQSYWQSTGFNVGTMGAGAVPAERGFCRNPGVVTYGHSGSIRHPSGAVAKYRFEPTLHGRSWARYGCNMPDSTGSGFLDSIEYTPAKYYTWSLVSKTVTGPGIDQPYTWAYSYGPANGCYADGSKEPCQANSPATKWVDVKDAEGVTTRHTFGNRFNVDEGYLLSSVQPGRATTLSYQLDASGSYPALAGRPAYQRASGIIAAKQIPLLQKVIEQDGVRYIWKVNTFDSMARPVSITEASQPVQ